MENERKSDVRMCYHSEFPALTVEEACAIADAGLLADDATVYARCVHGISISKPCSECNSNVDAVIAQAADAALGD